MQKIGQRKLPDYVAEVTVLLSCSINTAITKYLKRTSIENNINNVILNVSLPVSRFRKMILCCCCFRRNCPKTSLRLLNTLLRQPCTIDNLYYI